MLKDLQCFADAAAGLGFEHHLFTQEGPQIGMWTAERRGLVCPKAYEKRAGFDAAVANSAARGWPVHLRPTGGGTVPQGPGVDNLVLAFNPPKNTTTIEDVYRLLTDVIKAAYGPDGHKLAPGETPGSFCDGTWNLSVAGQKVVGTAQRWRPVRGSDPRVLAHALFLTQRDITAGAEAVAAFHADLGLSPIRTEAHTSFEAAFGISSLPAGPLFAAAKAALP